MVSAVILSGGQSKRMGQEKGLMPFCGKRLIEFVLEAIVQVSDDVIISVAPGKSVVYEKALGHGFRLVEDKAKGLGPIEGLISAFEVVRSESVLVSPCDTPFLNTSVCDLLISRSSGKDGAVPRIRGFLEPLHAVYAKKTGLDAFAKTLGVGRRRIVEAFDELDLVEIDEESLKKVDPSLDSFWNLNTREDILFAEQKMWSKMKRP